VNVGSAAQVDPGGYGPYGAAKEAIRTLSRAAAAEWGRDGIRVNVVVPFSESPSMEAALPNAATDAALLRRIPLRRVGDPRSDVGRVVVFLAGPDSAYVTGQLIAADGGMAHFR
jgi:NAD(P)-dependent dehydrogenase (short-subunit alcohol dehydrogenase family)